MESTIYIHNYSNKKCCNDHTARDFGLIFHVSSHLETLKFTRFFKAFVFYSNENKMRFELHNTGVIDGNKTDDKFTDSIFLNRNVKRNRSRFSDRLR